MEGTIATSNLKFLAILHNPLIRCYVLSRLIKSFPAIPNIMLSLLWYSVHFVTQEQNTTSTTPSQPRTQPRPSARASYKGDGCNNAKPPRPPHRNTMIDIVVRRHRLGCMFWAKFGRRGGFDAQAASRWEDRNEPSIPVQKNNHTAINRRSGASLCSANQPGDGTAASFVATEIRRGNIRRSRGVEGMADW